MDRTAELLSIGLEPKVDERFALAVSAKHEGTTGHRSQARSVQRIACTAPSEALLDRSHSPLLHTDRCRKPVASPSVRPTHSMW
jgi:hypothetical protein